MGTFSIISTSVVKYYNTDGDGFVANGSFEIANNAISKLDGVVYDNDFMQTYLGRFDGKLVDGVMKYKKRGDIERISSAIIIIERYIKELYNT